MDTAERFWAKVNKTSGCWLWTASTTPNGYGQFRVDDKNVRAHRWSYEQEYGPITGPVLRHTCDEPLCVRPSHLIPGTHQDNFDDMVRRGRQSPHVVPQTVCKKGLHDLTIPGSTRACGRGTKQCAECYREHRRKTRRKAVA